ncbi:MAG TPA: hypothetical protein VIP46_02765 [Pyrinomonadaceae bacterium]
MSAANIAAVAPVSVRPAPPCENCKWVRRRSRVVCERKDFGMSFDVQKAARIVRDHPRPLESWTPRQLSHYVTEADVTLRHLPHVDNSKPGIVGVVRHRGRLRKFIVEGNHRAFNKRRAREPYHFYPLTEEETARCRK